MPIIAIMRDQGTNPCIVRVTSNDTYDQITSIGYLDEQNQNILDLNGGQWSWESRDNVLVNFDVNKSALFNLSHDFGTLIPITGTAIIDLENNLFIADNGNDDNNGTLGFPVLTLAKANEIIAANPGTNYNVFDYRKTAAEDFNVEPNTNYYSFGTIISFTDGGLTTGWSTASEICNVNGYIFNTTSSITFDFSSFTTSHIYRLNFINCASTQTGTGTFIFKGYAPAPSGTTNNVNIYVKNFQGSQTIAFNAGLSFTFQESLIYRFEGGQINALNASMSIDGPFIRQQGWLIQTYMLDAPHLSMTSAINHGSLVCSVFGPQVINGGPTIVANQIDGTIELGMDANCYRFDTFITGTAIDKVYINALSKSKGVGYDGGNQYFIGQNGRDVPWAGTPGIPYATLSYAMTQFVNFGNSVTPTVLTFIDNVDDTGTTTNFVPNIIIDLNGFTWTHGVVQKDSSWTKAGQNNSIFNIINGRIIPATSGSTTWNLDFTAETDIALNLTLQNIYTTDRNLKPTDTWQFTFNNNSSNAHLFFNNCQLSDINDSGNNTIKCFGEIDVNFEGGTSPRQCFCQSANGGGHIWITGTQIVDPNTFILDGFHAYVNNISNTWDQVTWLVLLGADNHFTIVEFDASMYGLDYINFGQLVNGSTKNSGGAGYINATVTFDAPSLPFGVTATGTANIVGDAVDSITIDNPGSGYITVPNISISGDGSGADFTAQLDNGFHNIWYVVPDDTIIRPTYSPANYTPVNVDVAGSSSSAALLKSHLHGIDNQLGIVETDISTIQGDIATINGEITTIQGDITTINSEITTIQGDITTINGDIATINGEITTINGQITTINGEITTIQGNITTINGQITTINNQLAAYTYSGTTSTFGNGDITVSRSASGATVGVNISNASNTASSDARTAIAVAGGSGGDPYIAFGVTSGSFYSLGIDNSDSDKFKGFLNGTMTGSTFIEVTSNGEIIYPKQPAFSAYLATTANNKTGNGATYQLGTDALTKIFDQGNNFNTNGTFTTPVTGIYDLRAQVTFTGTTIATSFTINIVTTNKTYTNVFTRAALATNQGISISILAPMIATDTAIVTVVASGEAADTDDISGAASGVTFFCGTLVA